MRNAVAVLVLILASVASAAFAGGDFYGHRPWRGDASCETPRVSASFSWRSGDIRPIGFGAVAFRERGYGDRAYDGGRGFYGARSSRDEACAVDHPPHAWYDGRLWCSGKNADGSWRGPWHCEDQFGRKKVNLASFDPGCEKWIR